MELNKIQDWRAGIVRASNIKKMMIVADCRVSRLLLLRMIFPYLFILIFTNINTILLLISSEYLVAKYLHDISP